MIPESIILYTPEYELFHRMNVRCKSFDIYSSLCVLSGSEMMKLLYYTVRYRAGIRTWLA